MSDVSTAHDEPKLQVAPERLAQLRADLEGTRAQVRQRAPSLSPHRGLELVLEISDAVDRQIRALAAYADDQIEDRQGRDAASLVERVEIVALGGYGRRELCPHSDLDLLFLLPDDALAEGSLHPAVQQLVETVLYGLWDLGFEVGQAVRTVDDTLAVAREDASVLTALLDARIIARGGVADAVSPCFDALYRRLEAELLSGPRVATLIDAKLSEARARRGRFGDSVFLLEPNVKESEGGLRELHTALWVARARWRARGARELIRLGVLSNREGGALERAYGFLLRVRLELHLIARRRQDNLRFEHQEQIAPRLGYLDPTETDHDRRTHGVERFMRAYYFHARQMRHHAKLVVERATSHRRRKACQALGAPGGFKVWDGKLTVAERSQFLKDPAALLRIFRVAQEEAIEIYSYTKNLVSEHLHLIDKDLRRDPAVVRELLTLLEDPKADGSVFDTLHDLGVLRRLVPEISRVTSRWQHSLYHVYTVDVHSLVVFKNLKRLRNGAFSETEPEMTRLCAELPRPAVLNLAGILHDVGKGWPRGDHSVRGEKVARTVGARLEAAGLDGWTGAETRDLAWLVRQHLTMSNISQRRDLSDPELLDGFAEEVENRERLTMLYLLTFADMLGTSPKVWTDWKRGLLRELFHATRSVILHRSQGREQVDLHFAARRRRAERDLLEQAARKEELSVDPEVVRTFLQVVPARYMLSFNAKRMIRHVQMWRDVSRRGGLAMHVRHLRRDRTTKLTVVCPDQPGLLALIAGTLASHRLQILSAQVFSTDPLPDARPIAAAPMPTEEAEAYAHVDSAGPARGRMALDVLFVTDERGGLCDDAARWAAVRADIRAVVKGEIDVDALIAQRLGSGLDARHRPVVKNEVVVAPEDSNRETVIDVFCEDRLGTLYALAKTLSDQGLSISLAKISTQGHRVADGFYVTDAKTGAKVESQERLREVSRAIEAALDTLAD